MKRVAMVVFDIAAILGWLIALLTVAFPTTVITFIMLGVTP